MEEVTYAIGNPATLLIERIFWLGLGGFLGVAIITSLVRGLKENKNKTKPYSKKVLVDPAEKATQQNKKSNKFNN